MRKLFITILLIGFCQMTYAKEINNGMIVRISEIEIVPEYFDQYTAFAKNVAEASVKNEPGVIAIYPMSQIRDRNQIRILEIYKDKDAYQKHIKSEHFKTYKTGTAHMVKSLDLVDTQQISPAAFEMVFKKSEENK